MEELAKKVFPDYHITASNGAIFCRKDDNNICFFCNDEKIFAMTVLIYTSGDSFSITINIPADNTLSAEMLMKKIKNYLELYAFEKFVAARAYLLGHNINLAPSLS